MKTMKAVLILLTLFFVVSNCYSQTIDYPSHLFLGSFTMTKGTDKTTEIWEQGVEDELIGKTLYEYSGGMFLSETMKISYIYGKLNYCATVLEQNHENPQGEICFELKSYNNNVFTFENLNHDYPKRIIYDFNNYRTIKARVEGDTSGFNLEYEREYDLTQSYPLKGTFIKELFDNKAGKIIEGVFDYFFEIQGIRYFVKFKDNTIKIEEINKVLNKEVKATVVFQEGLWDSDDNTHQSRVGKYVSIIKILK